MKVDDTPKRFEPRREMTYDEYKEHVKERLNRLVPMFAKSSVGDFLADVDFPDEEDEFTEFYSGIQIMLDVIREKLEAERKKTEEWEALVSSIGEGVIVTNEEGEISYVNSEAEKMLLWKSEDILGKNLSGTIVLMDEKGVEISTGKMPTVLALTTKSKVAGKYIYQRKDETKFNVFITVTPYLIGGKTVGTIEVFRDITKEAEIEKRKDEFLSIAAHQLRTPLGAMRWGLEFLLSEKKDEISAEAVELIEKVYAKNQRLIDLIGSLLSVSRIESGRIVLSSVPTDLKVLVKSVIDELQVKLEAKKHRIEFRCVENLPTLGLDQRLIREVYLNLLSNAITYTPEGGKIEIKISKFDDEILSEVKDNGIGIAADEKKRVFERFFRGREATKIDTTGSGLGLYLVKVIVESSGGKIWYDSEENVGTTFKFTLPISKAFLRIKNENTNS